VAGPTRCVPTAEVPKNRSTVLPVLYEANYQHAAAGEKGDEM